MTDATPVFSSKRSGLLKVPTQLNTGNVDQISDDLNGYNSEVDSSLEEESIDVYSDDDNDNNNGSNNQLSQEELTSQISHISGLSIDRKSLIEKCITHYDNMDDHITRLPQFNKRDDFLKCLSQFTTDYETLKKLSKFKSKLNATSPSISYEIIVENQRGATVFGSKYYSKESVLYPLDPPKYQTLKGENLSDLSMYPEPSYNWKWSWNQWHVMMINDVDEEGWIYSKLRFGSYHWTGVGKFGNFARRRIWIRMAEKIDDALLDISSDEEGRDETDDENVVQFSGEAQKPHSSHDIPLNNNDGIEEAVHVLSNFGDKDHNSNHLIRKLNNKVQNELNAIHKIRLSYNHVHRHTRKNKHTKRRTDNKESSIEPYRGNNHNVTSSGNPNIHYSDNDVGSDSSSVHDLHVMHSMVHKEVPWGEEDLAYVKKTLNDINDCLIDRMKIEKLILFLLSLKKSTLEYLIFDYENSDNKYNSYLIRLLFSIHFHDSRRVFIKHLEHEMDKKVEFLGDHSLLRKIFLNYKEIVDNSRYNSEKD